MKKSILSIFAVTSLANLSMYSNHMDNILDLTDYRWEELDQANDNYALSGGLVDGVVIGKSYNQWQCFPSKELEFQCAEEIYPTETIKVPLMHITQAGHLYELSMESDSRPDCEHVIQDWEALIQDEETFCVYAAYLQEIDYGQGRPSDGSVWIIDRLKTRKGYWSFDSEENYLADD